MKNIFHLFFLLFLVNACSIDDDAPCLPPPNSFQVHLIDEAGNSLIGSTYTSSAFPFYNQEDSTALVSFDNPFLTIAYEELQSEKDYFLELSEEDTDTLWVKWHSIEGSCHGSHSYIMDSLRFNGTPRTIQSSHRIVLTK